MHRPHLTGGATNFHLGTVAQRDDQTEVPLGFRGETAASADIVYIF